MALHSFFEILIQMSMPSNETNLNCDECFVVMEYFVDLVFEGFSLDEITKPLYKHIEHCPDCQEHHLQKIRDLEEQWRQR